MRDFNAVNFSFCFIIFVQNSHADWAAISDKALAEADLIVYGQYLGQSTLKTQDQDIPSYIGVLLKAKTLKGVNSASVIFIKRYSLKVLLEVICCIFA